LVDILKDGHRWETLASEVMRDNFRRLAFQEEYAEIIPGWRELV
jgi:hypothetical protein